MREKGEIVREYEREQEKSLRLREQMLSSVSFVILVLFQNIGRG